jgi:hypothetical protein
MREPIVRCVIGIVIAPYRFRMDHHCGKAVGKRKGDAPTLTRINDSVVPFSKYWFSHVQIDRSTLIESVKCKRGVIYGSY